MYYKNLHSTHIVHNFAQKIEVMNRRMIMFLCLLAYRLTCLAQVPVGIQIHLYTHYDYPAPLKNNRPRSPMQAPTIYFYGNTLYLGSNSSSYVLQIIDPNVNEDILYTDLIPENVAYWQLPLIDSGEYIIQFIKGNYCFWGYIYL